MRRKLRYGRDKMLGGGSTSAAIMAAAGMTSAASLAAAGIGANAARDQARRQAESTINGAIRQANAIKDQTAKTREYQLASQSFIKDENAQSRALQENIQLQLQTLTGQQNINDRLDASRIAVKAGGKTRKLRQPTFLLRGGNMPFRVTDGGGVLPKYVTPEGYDLYEIIGKDHEHYHKTRQFKSGGKWKSGVGIEFADGNIVEGEGNQDTNQGEYMLVTPDNAYFISKHNIDGFNPAKAVNLGMHPLQAYAIQEQKKNAIGMNDDGSKAKYGKKFLIGGTPNDYDYINMNYPQVGTDTVGDTTVGVVYATQNPTEKRRLRNGGTVRRKAPFGTTTINKWWNSLTPIQQAELAAGTAPRANVTVSRNTSGINNNTINSITSPQLFEHAPYVKTSSNTTRGSSNTTGFKGWVNNNADLLGAGINALGNIGGAWLTKLGNDSASSILADAYNQRAAILDEAYRNLPTIDMNILRREDYRAAHMMPALQAPVSFADNQIAAVNRSLQRRLRDAGRYSMSGAATQDRRANAEIETQDSRNKIYSTDQQQKQEIRQKNAERVSESSRVDAMLDMQANEKFNRAYLDLFKYKYDNEVQRRLGSADALSEGAVNSANAIAQGRVASAQAFANAVANIGLTFGNTLSSMAKRRADFENTMLGATTDAQINQIARSGSNREKRARLDAVRAAIRSGRLSPEDEAKYRYYEELLLKSV